MNGKRVVRFILLVLLLSNMAACRCGAPPVGAAADLSAERTKVEFRHPGEAVKEVRVGQLESVGTGDQINTDSSGVGILKFSAFLRVKIFRETGLRVKAAPDSNASPIVKLYLALGTTHQELQSQANQVVDVTTETDWATIRATATAYLVSVDNDEVTWVVALDGEVEMGAQGQTVIVRAGQAAWVEPGQPPRSPVEVDLDEIQGWLERLGGTGEVGPIRPVIVPPEPEEEDGTEPWLEVWHSPSEPNEEQAVTVIAEAGDDESGLDRIEIQMPGQPLVTCWESPCQATGGPYSAGEFSYEVWVFDRAGNVTYREVSITVVPPEEEDQTQPWLEVWHSPSEPNEELAVTVIAEAGDDESGLDRIEIEMPGQPLVTCRESPCQATGGPYPAGEFGYEVRAFDRVGNVAYREGHFAVAAIVVQDNPPVVEEIFVEPTTLYQREMFRLKVSASDDTGLQSIRWWIEGTGDDGLDRGDEAGCDGMTWCEPNWLGLKWTGREGQFTIYAQARDTADQLSGVKSTTITILSTAAERFSLLIGGGPFDNELVQKAVGLAINWDELRADIGEVVLVDFLSERTLAGPTGAADPERAKELVAEAGYYGFSTELLFDPADELAAKLAEVVASYIEVIIGTEFIGVSSADARAKLASMIEAGESGLLIERR
jgi:hypothetical protein